MSDQNTKTYPLSAIMGGEISDKERIAELAEAFNRVCDENADFVAESIKADRRIAELQNAFEDAVTRAEKAENRIAELEAEVMEFRSRGNVAMSSWDEERERALREGERVVALEAEVKTLREDAERYRWMRERHENTIMDIYNSISPAMIKPELLDAAIDAEREGK